MADVLHFANAYSVLRFQLLPIRLGSSCSCCCRICCTSKVGFMTGRVSLKEKKAVACPPLKGGQATAFFSFRETLPVMKPTFEVQQILQTNSYMNCQVLSAIAGSAGRCMHWQNAGRLPWEVTLIAVIILNAINCTSATIAAATGTASR